MYRSIGSQESHRKPGPGRIAGGLHAPGFPGRPKAWRPCGWLGLPFPLCLTFPGDPLILLEIRRSSDLPIAALEPGHAGQADARFGRSCGAGGLGPCFRPMGVGLTNWSRPGMERARSSDPCGSQDPSGSSGFRPFSFGSDGSRWSGARCSGLGRIIPEESSQDFSCRPAVRRPPRDGLQDRGAIALIAPVVEAGRPPDRRSPRRCSSSRRGPIGLPAAGPRISSFVFRASCAS